jgi:hydrogenase 3 maturation protease
LRGDDAAGILASQQLKALNLPGMTVLLGETAPENLTGEIKRLNPSHLILVDCAEMGAKPGEIKLIQPQQVAGYSFGTHSLPLSILVDYLLEHFPCKVLIIGIQPKNLNFNAPVSEEVQAAVKRLVSVCQKIDFGLQ